MSEYKIQILSTLRCYLSLIIVLVHTNFFTGGIIFSSNSFILNHIKRIPILGFISNNPFPVDIFWIISGFLCQLKLLSIDLNENSYRKYVKIGLMIFINRLIRLYPLYFLQVVYNYYSNELCTPIRLFNGLTFFLFSSKYNCPCVSVGWTSAIDAHGYVIIILLYLVLFKKKRVLEWCYFILYAYSVYSLITTTKGLFEEYKENDIVEELINGTRLWNGNDVLSPRVIEHYSGDNADIMNLAIPVKQDLLQARQFLRLFKERVYYTGILHHGAVMFLGALLALNWNHYLHHKSNTSMIWIRAVLGICILYITGGVMHFAGLPYYWILRAFLQLDYDVKHHPSYVQIILYKIFTLNRPALWNIIGKYTYGIYLTHMELLRYSNILYFSTSSIANLEQYYIPFFVVKGIVTWICSLVFSMALYHSIELPFVRFRRKYFGVTSGNVIERNRGVINDEKDKLS